jgi:hypothetical protein
LVVKLPIGSGGGNIQNATTPSNLVRRNLASHLQGASMCHAKLIPTEEQIWAATMQNAIIFLSSTAKREGFCATAEEVHATRKRKKRWCGSS